jgi:hypothetical protein
VKTIIFAYNTDSKIFGKVLGCNLAALTRKKLFGQDIWKKFLDGLKYHKVFYYATDFHRAHPELNNVALPAVFLKEEGDVTILLSSTELNDMSDVNELIGLIGKKLSGF